MSEPWTGWWDQFTGDADKSFSVEAKPSDLETLMEALQVRTDQRDQARTWAVALENRLDEIGALHVEGGAGFCAACMLNVFPCKLLELIDKPLGGDDD